MKKLLLLIPLFLIVFASCALYRVRKNAAVENPVETAALTAEESVEPETTTHGVLKRLFGRDQTTAAGTEKEAESKGNTKKKAKNSKKTTSAKKEDSDNNKELYSEEKELIERLGFNLVNITEKNTKVTMKLSNGLITETTSLKEVKPITSAKNSASPGGQGQGSSGDEEALAPTPSDKTILNSGKFKLEATVKKNNGNPTGFTIYADGDKYALFTDVNFPEVGPVKVEIIMNAGKIYFVVPKLDAYVNGGNADDYKFKKEVFDDIIIPVTSTESMAAPADTATVTIGGTEYSVEEYKAEGGQTVKYYCLGDKIERIEIINTDGNNVIIDISMLSPNLPADSFKIPSGCKDATGLAGKVLATLKEKSVL